MLRTHRLRLTGSTLFWHYSVVPFLLIPFAIGVWYWFQYYFSGTYTGVRHPTDMLKLQVPFLLIAILFLFIQWRRLLFRVFPIQASDKAFKAALARTAEELGWRITNNTKRMVRAHRPWSWSGSWGEMITIRRYKDKILINSICDPYTRPSVVSFGWNRRNVDTFITYLMQEVELLGSSKG